MTLFGIKTSMLIVPLLMLFSCKNDTGKRLVVSERFIHNRVKAHYYISLEKYNGNEFVGNSIGEWINYIVNDHLRWVYHADSTTHLQYNSMDFESQYRKFAHHTAQKYDKDLSICGNDVGEGEASQSYSLKIYKTSETDKQVSYTAEEYFCWGHTHPTRYKINVVFLQSC